MKYKKYSLIIITLFSIVIIYNNDFFMFRVIDRIYSISRGRIDFRETRDKLMKFVDDINPLKGKIFYKKDTLPIIELKLDIKDLNSITERVEKAKRTTIYILHMYDEINQYRKVKMFVGGKEYKIKFKLHGVDSPHFLLQKKSFEIKIRNKNISYYKNMKKFALIIPEEANIVSYFSYEIAKKINLLTPKHFFVYLKINGIDQGIYFLEESLNKTLLERNNLSGYDILKTTESWRHQYRGGPHYNPFLNEYSGLSVKNLTKKELQQLVIFKKLFNSTDIKFIKTHIYENEFAKLDALRVLFADRNAHSIDFDNLKLLLNTSTNKILPFFRIENVLKKLPLKTFEPKLYQNLVHKHINFFYTLIRDNSYRTKRNRILYSLLQQKDEILKLYNKIEAKYLPLLLNDTTNNVPTRFFKFKSKQVNWNLPYNFKVIKKYLEYARVFVDIVKKDKNSFEIKINPDSNSPIKTDNFLLFVNKKYIGNIVEIYDRQTGKKAKIRITTYDRNRAVINLTSFLKDNNYLLSLNKNLEPKKNPSYYTIKFNGNINDVDIHFFNDITKKEIKKVDTYTALADESKFDFKYLSMSIDEFIKKYKDINFTKIDEKNILLNSGNYIIKKTIILPYGVTLTIDKATNIKLAPQISLIVYSNINIKGTLKQPVIISNLIKNKPFGVVGAIGNGDKNCTIEHLTIYGGKDAIINGAYLSGGLSLYNHNKVTIKYSFIHHNSADDGLNIKNAEVEIANNTFSANRADQVDLDFCNGIAKNNIFVKPSNIRDFRDMKIPIDKNGDGFDLSGSKILILNNSYKGFLDKGISIGENTKAFIAYNRFLDNRSAITVKDQSKVYIYRNYYKNNKVNLEMYQKKKFFKHPYVYDVNDYLNNKIIKTKQSHYYKSKEPIHIKDIDTTIFNKLQNKNWVEYE